MSACGLDFGTSNSGVAVPAGDSIRLIELEASSSSIPSAVFFATEQPQPVTYGREAVRDYLDGTPGRLMRSLKSLLGSTLIDEKTTVGDRSIAFTDILALYLRMLRERAEVSGGKALESVVLGRPVRFVDDDLERDRHAQTTLTSCARAAGFCNIEFQLEPVAAAFDYERTIAREEAVLVIDVGGGTADFTVIRLGPDRRSRTDRRPDVLANGGVHIAGTDFDSRLNLSWVMPSLGYRSIGRRGLIIPSPIYFELSTWHEINFLYSPRTRETLRELQAFFIDPAPYARLCRVIDDRLGHELLGRTEAAKVELSQFTRAEIDLSHVEARLAVTVERSGLLDLLANLLARLVTVGATTVRAAGLTPATISTLYFTGGSSGMTALREAFRDAYPESRVVVGDLFGSVVSGLGIEAQRRFV
ncbi:MAG: Hsp70 family protein [Betaproteobacteria bacterium]